MKATPLFYLLCTLALAACDSPSAGHADARANSAFISQSLMDMHAGY